MFKLSNHKFKIVYHILFWSIYFLFNTFRFGHYNDDYLYSLKSNLVEFPIHILLVYYNIYILIPQYILKKKIWRYLFAILLLLFVGYIVRTGLNYLLVTNNIWPESQGSGKFLHLDHVIAVIIGEIYVLTFVTSIKLLIDLIIERKRNEKLKKIQTDTELDFLRTQMQPHFFFNTLNNLYSLSITNSKETPNMILRLSSFMEYILYDTKSDKIFLSDEIKQLHNLIDIYKIRYQDRFKIDFQFKSDVENIKVPPALFLNFLENCFKHGLRINHFTKIGIIFKVIDNKYLEFYIVNNIDSDQKSVTNFDKSGIGLDNIKRRLKILFKKNYKFETDIYQHKFSVYLKIPI